MNGTVIQTVIWLSAGGISGPAVRKSAYCRATRSHVQFSETQRAALAPISAVISRPESSHFRLSRRT